MPKMELDNFSVPCLLDEIEGIDSIKSDFNFGMLVDKTDAVKGSPSHESDSGVSDMVDLENDLRSVSPSSDGISEVGTSSSLFDFDTLPGHFLDDDLDAELASYFDDPLESDKLNRSASLDKNIVQQVMETDKTVSNHLQSKSPETDLDIETDNSDQENTSDSTILRAKRQVKFSKNTDVHILPSTSKDLVEIAPKPTVKVVKVIKTPATTPKSALDNQVIQAIDDRNKKNAIQAKMNREKKKAYIQSLEDEVENLKVENFAVRTESKKIAKERDALFEEVQYLKGVIANQTVLSGLLKNIGKVENVKLTSSFSHRKRSAELDHDYGNSGKRVKKTKTTAGVCLHVDEGNVSIEFCSKCAGMAKSTHDDEELN